MSANLSIKVALASLMLDLKTFPSSWDWPGASICLLILPPPPLWVNILKSKYLHSRSSSSFIWRGICLGWKLCQQGLSHKIGNGKHTLFWLDNWCGIAPLTHLLAGPLLAHHDEHPVSRFLIDGTWNLSNLPFDLPPDVKTQILSTHIPLSPQPDAIVWNLTPSGLFSTKSALALLKH